jgi:hypothetical protein
MKFERYNIGTDQLFKEYSRKASIIFLVTIVVSIILTGILITLMWHYLLYGSEEAESYSSLLDGISIILSFVEIVLYIAIFLITLVFFHLFTTLFGNESMSTGGALKKKNLWKITIIIGICACIFQLIAGVIYLLQLKEIIEFDPYIDLGSRFWLYTLNIPSSISYLLIVIYLLLIFNTTLKLVPTRLRRIVIGRYNRIDASTNLRIASILIIIFSITNVITYMIRYDYPTYGPEMFGMQRQTIQSLIIDWVYRFLDNYSRLFVYFGFLLICQVFYHIFRNWEYVKLAEAGKPT